MTRLPAETVPTTYYDPAVKARVSSSITLDAGRMPTVRGRAGVIADRSKFAVSKVIGLNGKPIPHLLPVYMLASLRRPSDPKDNAEFFVLSVHDWDRYRQDPDAPAHLRNALPGDTGRFSLDVWEAEPDRDDPGNPEIDASWNSISPVLGFTLDEHTTLAGARAACEVLAGLLVRGEVHPDGDLRDFGQAFARLSTVVRARYGATAQRILAQHGKVAAGKFAVRVNARAMRTLDRREVRQHRRVHGLLLRAARRADKTARVQAARAVPPIRRALDAVKR